MPADKHASVLVNCLGHLILTKTGMSQRVTETPQVLWKSIKKFFGQTLKRKNVHAGNSAGNMGGGKSTLVSCVSPDHSGTDQCKIFLHTNYYRLCIQLFLKHLHADNTTTTNTSDDHLYKLQSVSETLTGMFKEQLPSTNLTTPS
jgi:hypothetical protein